MPAKQRHRGMCVRVDTSVHQEIGAAVRPPWRRSVLPRRTRQKVQNPTGAHHPMQLFSSTRTRVRPGTIQRASSSIGKHGGQFPSYRLIARRLKTGAEYVLEFPNVETMSRSF